MANNDRPTGFRFVRSMSGQMAPVRGRVAASQIIAKDDALIINGSGLIEIAVATSGQIYGVADAPITTTGSVDETDTVQFYPAHDQAVFEAQTSGSSTLALVGTDVDIEGATGAMEVNENATTEQVFRILGLKSDKDVELELGLNDRVYGIFTRSQWNNYRAAL